MQRTIRLPPLSHRPRGFAPRFCAPDLHPLRHNTVYVPRKLDCRLFVCNALKVIHFSGLKPNPCHDRAGPTAFRRRSPCRANRAATGDNSEIVRAARSCDSIRNSRISSPQPMSPASHSASNANRTCVVHCTQFTARRPNRGHREKMVSGLKRGRQCGERETDTGESLEKTPTGIRAATRQRVARNLSPRRRPQPRVGAAAAH